MSDHQPEMPSPGDLPPVPADAVTEEAARRLQQELAAHPESRRQAIAFINDFYDRTLPMRTFMSYYECALLEIETKFRVLNKQFSQRYDANPIESIKTRVKSPQSLAVKIIQKGIPWTWEAIEENIRDIAGIRVVCSFEDDIYRLAKSFLRQTDITLLEIKDYIKNPKPSGYRSLHLIVSVPIFLEDETKDVTVEVQLRTIAMDFWAALEHKLRYKKDLPEAQQEKLAAALEQCAQDSARLDARMQEIKNELNG
jgi:putative GTP pyrophosphokinase